MNGNAAGYDISSIANQPSDIVPNTIKQRRPDLTVEDVALVARTLKAFHDCGGNIRRTRMQSSMHSLRFSARVASYFGVPSCQENYTIESEDLVPDSLVISDDIRLISICNNSSIMLINLLSITVLPDSLYGYRVILWFWHVEDTYSLLQAPSPGGPKRCIVVAGTSELMRKFVSSIYSSASIYFDEGALKLQFPEAEWVFDTTRLSSISRTEARHIVICELLQMPVNEVFLQRLRHGFEEMFDAKKTLNLCSCIGDQKLIASLASHQIQAILFTVLFSLRYSAGVLFRAVHAFRLPLSDGTVRSLMKVLDPSKIEHFELIDCCITATGFSHILYRLATSQNTSALRSIILTGNPIGDHDIASLIRILPSINPNLEVLKIGSTNSAMQSAASLSQMLSLTKLQRLDISGISLTRVSAEDIGSGIRQALHLRHVSCCLAVDNVHILINALADVAQYRLESFVAVSTVINSKGIASLARLLKTTLCLSSLIISQCGLTRNRLSTLLVALAANPNNFSLVLDVSKNNLKGGVAYSFARVQDDLNQPCHGLSNIIGLFLGSNNITGSDLKSTCSVLKLIPRLSFVSFDGPEVSNSPVNRVTDATALSSFLAQSPQISCLSMRGILGPKGVRAFCKACLIHTNPTSLQTIDISSNAMDLKAFVAFCDFLLSTSASSLTNLILDNNRATPECVIELRNALKRNSKVCYVQINHDCAEISKTANMALKNESFYDVVRDIEMVTVANKWRYREREQEVPVPLHLCIKNIISLKDPFANINSVMFQPEAPSKRSVFGIDLFRLECSIEKHVSGPVPVVLQLINNTLETLDAYKTEGIFRIAPSKSEQETVRSFLEQAVYPRCQDVHAVADVCKQWLRELPSRLFDILSVETIVSGATPEIVGGIVWAMPEPWRSTTRFLMHMCARVASFTNENKMTPKGLAIILSPNMISDSKLEIGQAIDIFASVKIFLENAILFALSENKENALSF